jgi:ATP-dependent Clp protease protease subunit
MLLKKLVQFQRKRIYQSIPINRFYHERLFFLGQHVDDEIANQLIGIMMYLNGDNESKDMYLYINSLGGAVLNGIFIYDVMQFVVPNVHHNLHGIGCFYGIFHPNWGRNH